MASRLTLHELLKSVLGSNKVYFQPPASLKLTYPCIVYSLNRIDSDHADNAVYKKEKSYSIILITNDPDNTIVDDLASIPRCRMERSPYVSENLYHYPFILFY